MATVNKLGQNDAALNCTEIDATMDSVRNGVVSYSWGDGCSGLKLKGKLCTCRTR